MEYKNRLKGHKILVVMVPNEEMDAVSKYVAIYEKYRMRTKRAAAEYLKGHPDLAADIESIKAESKAKRESS